jgi:hypothetical protein
MPLSDIHIYSLLFTVLLYAIGILTFLTLLFIYVSNPFRKLTIVRTLYASIMVRGSLMLLQRGEPKIRKSALWKAFAWVKCGAHILKNSLVAAPKARGTNVDAIIREIHTRRFNPSFPFLISGDHFSMFYPRNLGVFYHPMMDPRVALDDEDWLNREKKYLQSAAYAVETFARAKMLSTTIVPSGRRGVTLIQIFAYPSDTLYGILHALETMRTPQLMKELFPTVHGAVRDLHTASATEELIDTHRSDLVALYEGYRRTVFDEGTGLIREGLRLSSALDTKIRSSAFYDNVVFWRTSDLMRRLGLIAIEDDWLDTLKERILKAFWFEEGGYFLDDLSPASRSQGAYASDWTVILTSGFLHPSKSGERGYFARSIDYVRACGLDKPFPLKVMGSSDRSKDHFWVRTFVSNYQDNAIWSNLGMQYTKILVLMADATGNSSYLADADRSIASYRNNMVTYRGYPEVYDGQGDMLRGTFYRSIRQTGWVIDFEHLMALREAVAARSPR